MKRSQPTRRRLLSPFRSREADERLGDETQARPPGGASCDGVGLLTPALRLRQERGHEAQPTVASGVDEHQQHRGRRGTRCSRPTAQKVGQGQDHDAVAMGDRGRCSVGRSSSERRGDLALAQAQRAAALSKPSSGHDSTTGLGGAAVTASDAALLLPPRSDRPARVPSSRSHSCSHLCGAGERFGDISHPRLGRPQRCQQPRRAATLVSGDRVAEAVRYRQRDRRRCGYCSGACNIHARGWHGTLRARLGGGAVVVAVHVRAKPAFRASAATTSLLCTERSVRLHDPLAVQHESRLRAVRQPPYEEDAMITATDARP